MQGCGYKRRFGVAVGAASASERWTPRPLANWLQGVDYSFRTENPTLEASGTHCICELYDCPSGLLNDRAFVEKALRGAVAQGMATLLHEVSHKFHPQGVTALALIAESHVAIHTWPEYGYAGVDVFTCGDRASAEKACAYLIREFQAGRHTMKKLARGTDLMSGPAVAEAVLDTCCSAPS